MGPDGTQNENSRPSDKQTTEPPSSKHDHKHGPSPGQCRPGGTPIPTPTCSTQAPELDSASLAHAGESGAQDTRAALEGALLRESSSSILLSSKLSDGDKPHRSNGAPEQHHLDADPRVGSREAAGAGSAHSSGSGARAARVTAGHPGPARAGSLTAALHDKQRSGEGPANDGLRTDADESAGSRKAAGAESAHRSGGGARASRVPAGRLGRTRDDSLVTALHDKQRIDDGSSGARPEKDLDDGDGVGACVSAGSRKAASPEPAQQIGPDHGKARVLRVSLGLPETAPPISFTAALHDKQRSDERSAGPVNEASFAADDGAGSHEAAGAESAPQIIRDALEARSRIARILDGGHAAAAQQRGSGAPPSGG